MRLDPFYPSYALFWLGSAFYMLKRYPEALPRLRECVLRAPNFMAGHKQLAATYAQLGQLQQAREESAKVLRMHPNWTISGVERHFVSFKSSDDLEHYLDGLRKAGLPE